MKILFISYRFPPYNSSGAVRTGKTAKYLIELGNDVRVITARNQPLPADLSLEVPEEKVIYTPWLNVDRVVEIVMGGRKKVIEQGLSNIRSKDSIMGKLGIIYKNLLHFPDAEIGWFPYARAAGSRLIQAWRPDVIFASAVPYTSLLVASSLSSKYHIPWIGELRDLWMDNPYRQVPAWRRTIEKRIEKRVLSSAAGLITVSDPLKEILRNDYNKPIATVMNGFDPEDYPENSQITNQNGTINIVYTGMLYEGKRDPTPLFEALKLFKKGAEKTKVTIYGRNVNIAHKLALRYNVEHLVKVHGPVSHEKVLNIQSQADILLLLTWNDPAEKGVYTGKLFEYLGARRPILAIGSSNGVAANLIREREAGVVLHKAHNIARQLEYWITQKEKEGTIPALSEKVGYGFTRKEQTTKLAVFINHCLKQLQSAVYQ